jgi:phosphoribosylaminoimidazole-succinocarboxamide synthase
MAGTLLKAELPGIALAGRGKVRDMFHVDGNLLIVSTDRMSAFDVVLPDGIPDKGKVLTQLSKFWFGRSIDIVPNHMITADVAAMPDVLTPHRDMLAGRSMLVKLARPLPVECVVRGYLVGGGWREYQATGGVCGIDLPAGLRQADKLPEPIFTLQQGVIIADTKFEFGLLDGGLLLIDEVLTPDSSRFWDVNEYEVGMSPPSFDKQFVRDYLDGLDWDKTPPGPQLPAEVIRGTTERYREAYRRLTGTVLD